MIRLATAADIAAIEAIVQAAYSPYIERIGRKPWPRTSGCTSAVAMSKPTGPKNMVCTAYT